MVSIDAGLRVMRVVFRRAAVLAAAAVLGACGGGGEGGEGGDDGGGGGGGGGGANTGIRGSLTVSGSAAAPSGGSFAVSAGYTGNKILTTGPSCITLGATTSCSASWQINAYEVSGMHVEQLTVVLVSSSGSPPGPQPGSPPTTMLVGFAFVDGSTTTMTLVGRCDGPDRNTCASLSDLGVTLDTSARTVTFVNVRAADENDNAKAVVLNGVIRY